MVHSPFLLLLFSFIFSPTHADRQYPFPLFLYFSPLSSSPHVPPLHQHLHSLFSIQIFCLSFSFVFFSFFFPTYRSQIFYPFFSSLSLPPPTQAQILLLDDEAERVRGNGIDGNNIELARQRARSINLGEKRTGSSKREREIKASLWVDFWVSFRMDWPICLVSI
jgi:hypothetical protein